MQVLIKDLVDKKKSLDLIVKEIDKTKISEQKRMTANHTYNSKTQRGRLTQVSKSYYAQNKINLNQFQRSGLGLNKKGSIFNDKKIPEPCNSKLDFSDLKRISSFKAGKIDTETSTEQLGKPRHSDFQN